MKKNHGATLAELVIVMAVLAIMMVMVLSFTVLCNAWVKLGTFRYNLIREKQNVADSLSSFVSYLDESDYCFYTEGERTLIARRSNGKSEEYKFSFDVDSGTVSCNLPTSDTVITVEKIDDIYFSIRPAKEGDTQLIYCTVSFAAPKVDQRDNETHDSYRILVATRAAGNHGGN